MASPETGPNTHQPTVTEKKLSETEIREKVPSIVPPEWLKIFEDNNPQIAEMNKEPIEGFEERRRAQTRESIEKENTRRALEGKEPITIVGVHAAPKGDALSSQMLYRMTESAESVGVRRKVIELSNDKGKVDPEMIEKVAEELRKADGLLITTHTKGGNFSSFYTMLRERLEEEDLHGKVVGFAHTYDDPEKDEQVGPPILAQSFFSSKGCLTLPYTFMYANTESKDEPWVQQDIVGNGIRLARGIERATRSNLVNLLEDPDKLEDRKVDGKLSPEWQNLKERVAMVNEERQKNGQKKLNVLFCLGGEDPGTLRKEINEETGETKGQWGGRGARISKLLAKNFEFLGLETDTIHLASQEDQIASTAGNPNLILSEVVEGQEKSNADASMQEIYKKLLEADMVIFNSPVRWFNYSWHLQKLIERITPLEASGFLLEGKAFGTIITFGEAGAEESRKKLEHIALHNGLMPIPMGGLGQHLSMDLEDSPGLPFKAAHGVAARGTSLLVDYLAADGPKISKMDFKGLRHQLEEIVDPGD